MTTTTHRPSFDNGKNCFWTLTRGGDFALDGCVFLPPSEMIAKFQLHRRDGYHPDCVICQQKAQEQYAAEARDWAEQARDERPM